MVHEETIPLTEESPVESDTNEHGENGLDSQEIGNQYDDQNNNLEQNTSPEPSPSCEDQGVAPDITCLVDYIGDNFGDIDTQNHQEGDLLHSDTTFGCEEKVLTPFPSLDDEDYCDDDGDDANGANQGGGDIVMDGDCVAGGDGSGGGNSSVDGNEGKNISMLNNFVNIYIFFFSASGQMAMVPLECSSMSL